MALLRRVAESLVEDAGMEKAPSFEGRFLAMILAPVSAGGKSSKQKTEQSQQTEKEKTRA